MVSHTYSPGYSEVRDQKDPISTKKAGCCGAYLSSQEAQVGGLQSECGPSSNHETLPEK
jgi:hypothetical protein